MDALRALITRFGMRPGSRHWIGPRPSGEFENAAMNVAKQVGYPTCVHFPFEPSSFLKIDRARAAELLAFFSKASLAYGTYSVREGLQELAVEALTDLKKGSLFYTNGDWRTSGRGAGGSSWQALSDATFDGEVIGFDFENAFVFWVEEED